MRERILQNIRRGDTVDEDKNDEDNYMPFGTHRSKQTKNKW